MDSSDWEVMECNDGIQSMTWDGEPISCFRLKHETNPMICAGFYESLGIGYGLDLCASLTGVSISPFVMRGLGGGLGIEFGIEHDEPLVPALGIQENLDIGDGTLTPFDGPIDVTLTNCLRADAGYVSGTTCNDSSGSNSTTVAVLVLSMAWVAV